MNKSLILRYLYFLLTALYWGGFTFYAGFVVPIGMQVLGSHTTMGFITQQVTISLNFVGLVWVVIAFLNSKKRLKWLVLSMFILIVTLLYLHHLQTNLMDFNNRRVLLSNNFYTLHRVYLMLSTLIWCIIPSHFYLYLQQEKLNN